jgi:predicted lipoprotein with Yx(FWY)xxD motif
MAGEDGGGGESDTGGTGNTGSGGTTAGSGGQGGVGPLSCVYHSPPVPLGQGGTAGADGGAGTAGAGTAGAAGAPVYDVNVRVSPTVGKYLADANGMTLYIRTSDLPGDCQPGNPPISRCTSANAACSTVWPIFHAGARTLDPQLDDAAFGTILRDDGVYQTTYFGWPLYTYATDLTAGQITGQSRGKVWYVAEVKLPNVVIMQEGSTRYLADGTGRTLYVSSADVLGTDSTDPVSHCDSVCLQTYEPFREPRLYPVQSLEPDDFYAFLSGGLIQVAYRGAPLYRARTDVQGGDLTGVSGTFALVVP